MVDSDALRNAVVGAVVTLVFSFLGVSPLVGGGVAGYLQRDGPGEGGRVGALSGALATVPSALFVFTGVGVLGVGLAGELGLSVAIIVAILLVLALWNVALSAAGGYLGVVVREEVGT